ncbi:glycosyltransferase family 4 protein [Acidimicrobiia bacterium]|nr:glycosyltransferase family 4 protein [Acidimicrobiia bacterium]MDB4604811.1 glycosyltransferase family 4 protein [Acidimicrobiia bacterium]MDB4832615.1 glycosyltransferase family 4 protein [Acidimicrobiia bacterium]MDC0595960.1 glycosyltransferase family 4 protein [Acidimicrobiia bacterium]
MNILITVGVFPPDIGGPASFVPKISNFLIENGHNIKIICLAEVENNHTEDKLDVIRIKRSNSLPIRWMKTIYQIVKNGKKSDLIFVNGLGVESTIANLLIKKQLIRKIVGDPVWERAYNQKRTTESFDEFQNNKHSFLIEVQKLLRNWSINSAEIVITPSDHLKNFVSGLGFSNKILKINNGVDITDIKKTNVHKADVNLLIISRLVIQKNINIVIEAMELLDNKDLKLSIIGEGGEFSKLEGVIHDLNLQNRVRLLGKIDNNKISQFLLTADIFIQASDYEGLPHSVLEAINYEVPILSTEVGGCKDLLNDGERGFIIPVPPHKKIIAENIIFIINNKDEATKRADAAKAFISKEYNFLVQANHYMEIFQQNEKIEV